MHAEKNARDQECKSASNGAKHHSQFDEPTCNFGFSANQLDEVIIALPILRRKEERLQSLMKTLPHSNIENARVAKASLIWTIVDKHLRAS
mmetsp:Transcript_87217/g.136517  ORF Transcript_87217/g.136517 Transcript_87217/m.136517 type:complete len:91 (+) Transcript_87217:799-1071(+)